MEEKILSILTEMHPELDYTQDVNFIEEGMLDSFDVVDLVVQLEAVFNIKIDGVNIVPENFSSIQSISQLIQLSK